MPSQSIWQNDDGKRYKALSGEAKADVAIVGAGIAGLTAAYLLSSAGANVAVIEARAIGCGASGQTAAHITSQHGLTYHRLIRQYGAGRAGLIASANEGAISLAAGIVKAEEIPCGFAVQDSHAFTRQVGREEELEMEAEAASKLGIMADIISGEPFLLSYVAAVRFRGQAALHPVEYLRGLADAVARNAGRVYEQSSAVEIKDNTVKTQSGSVRAKCVVVATDFPIINVPGWYHLRMIHQRACAAMLDGVDPPKGLWVSCDGDRYAYRGQEGRLVVSRGGHSGRKEDDAGCHMALNRDMLEQFPNAKPVSLWSAQYADTVDGLPYIGKYSRNSGCMFIAAGLGRWGLSQGTVAGHIISDMILDRKNPYAELYSPQRHITATAWGHAATANVMSAWKLATSVFRPKGPACSHYGCGLIWNEEEKTWDCPCHGSRFMEDGSVLDAPAVKPIQPQRGP